MNVAARLVPVRLHSAYEGTKDGNPYVIGTWIVKSVVDNKEFAVKAFPKEHDYISANQSLQIDCELSITGKAWNDKFFNDVIIGNIIVPEGMQDVPVTAAAVVNNSLDPMSGLGIGADTGLPF